MRETYIRIISTFTVIVAAFMVVTIIGPHSTFAQNGSDIVPPANDMFSDAEIIVGPRGAVTGYNMDATVEPDEPMFYKGGQSVWYRWTSPAELSVTFDLRSSEDSPAGIAIYEGTHLQKLFAMGHGVHFDRVTLITHPMRDYSIQVMSKSTDAGGPFELSWDINGAETWKQFNFDGPHATEIGPPSGKSDFAIHRWWSLSQNTSQWWIWRSNTFTPFVYNFGDHFIAIEHLAPGDYDGDGLVDIGFFNKQTREFWIYQSGTNTAIVHTWGWAEDNPVQGDFDGDDMADIAIWRPSTGTFWILKSTDGRPYSVQWGMPGDQPVVGDYDGDGITDFAVRRGSAAGSQQAEFYVLRSSDWQVQIAYFGFGDDLTVPGDYDGDGKNDIAVFRPGNTTFYYLASSSGEAYTVPLAFSEPFENKNRAVPGDYFGDSRSDICVWLFRVGDFKCFADGGTGALTTFHFGLQGDEPVAFSNVH